MPHPRPSAIVLVMLVALAVPPLAGACAMRGGGSSDVYTSIAQGPVSGHRVEIVAIERGAAEAVVADRVEGPSRDAITAPMLTYPFHIVRTRRPATPVRFEPR